VVTTADEDSDFELSASDEEKLKKKKSSWFYKKKKAVASKAATSHLGKALLMKFVDDETLMLLNTLKAIITKEGGAKKAHLIKKDIIKIAVKVIMLYEDKYVTEASFDSLRFSFRRICSAVKRGWRPTTCLDKARIMRINKLANQFEIGLRTILKPHITDKTMKRIAHVVGFLADPKFIESAAKYPEFEKVVYVLAYYLQTY